MAQLAVARVARVFMVMPKGLLPVLPAQQVKDLHQARLQRLDVVRGIQTAYHPATSSATVPAVRDYLSRLIPLSDVRNCSCHRQHCRRLWRRTSSASRCCLQGLESHKMPYPWSRRLIRVY